MAHVRKHAKVITSVALLIGSIGFLYHDVIVDLIHDWATDDNYSHGFLIVPIALYFAWERRARIRPPTRQPSIVGWLVVAGSPAVLARGRLGVALFRTRVSVVGVLAGALFFVRGWP